MRLRSWIEAVGLALLVVFVVAGKDLTPFWGDEATIVSMSRDYDTLIKDRNAGALLYVPNPTDFPSQSTRLKTGAITSFLFGFGRDLADIPESQLNAKWNWKYEFGEGERMWQENVAAGNLPSHRLLSVARSISALLGGLSLILIFLAALRLGLGHPGAWAAVLVLASNARFLVEVRRAMQEGPKFFFLSLALLAAVGALANLMKSRVSRRSYLLLGLASGLSLATKHDLVMALAGIYLGIALVPLVQRGGLRLFMQNALYLAAATFFAIALFFALMPVLWVWWPNILICAGLGLLLIGMAALLGNEVIPNATDERAAKLTERVRRTIPTLGVGLLLLLGTTLYSPESWQQAWEPVRLIIVEREAQSAAGFRTGAAADEPYLEVLGRRIATTVTSVYSSRTAYYDLPTKFNSIAIQDQIRSYEASGLAGRNGPIFLDVLIALFALAGFAVAARQRAPEQVLLLVTFAVIAITLMALAPVHVNRHFLVLQIPYSLFAGMGVQLALGRLRQMNRA